MNKLTCNFILIASVAVCNAILSACDYNEETSDGIGRYLYLSRDEVLHISKECCTTQEGAGKHGENAFYYVDTISTKSFGELCCSQCFNDDAYRHLKRIELRNNNLFLFYNAISQKYSDIPNNFELFSQWFYAREDTIPNSKILFDAIKEDPNLSCKTYIDFMHNLSSNINFGFYIWNNENTFADSKEE